MLSPRILSPLTGFDASLGIQSLGLQAGSVLRARILPRTVEGGSENQAAPTRLLPQCPIATPTEPMVFNSI